MTSRKSAEMIKTPYPRRERSPRAATAVALAKMTIPTHIECHQAGPRVVNTAPNQHHPPANRTRAMVVIRLGGQNRSTSPVRGPLITECATAWSLTEFAHWVFSSTFAVLPISR